MIERIMILMEERGVNGKQLTTELELAQSTLSEWKKGKAKPSHDAIIKLADYFGVSTDYLLGRTDDRGKIKLNVEGDNNGLMQGTNEGTVNFNTHLSQTRKETKLFDEVFENATIEQRVELSKILLDFKKLVDASKAAEIE